MAVATHQLGLFLYIYLFFFFTNLTSGKKKDWKIQRRKAKTKISHILSKLVSNLKKKDTSGHVFSGYIYIKKSRNYQESLLKSGTFKNQTTN